MGEPENRLAAARDLVCLPNSTRQEEEEKKKEQTNAKASPPPMLLAILPRH
jgi:hypothetical protein